MTTPSPGRILWHDLTVDDAPRLRDFYAAVVGWRAEACAMDGYEDFSLVTPDGEATAGVCHARGPNADLPAQWLVYIAVADIDRSARTVTERGGRVIAPIRPLAGGRFCVIRDPAGAVCALYEPVAEPEPNPD